MNMPNFSKSVGIFLILLGTLGYVVTDATSWTALIPAFVGILMFLFGYFGEKTHLRRHLMHAAAVLALLGFIGTVAGIPKTVTHLTGGTIDRPQAAIVQAVMAIACLGYLIVAVKSFIAARRDRKV
jgi:hypothetical protein